MLLPLLATDASPTVPPLPGSDLTPEQFAAICGAEGGNAVCESVLRLLGDGTWQAWAARIAGGGVEIAFILVLAFVATRLAKRGIKRFVAKVQQAGVEKLGALQGKGPLAATSPINLQRATLRTETIGGILRSITTFAIAAVAFALVLGVFGIDLGPLIAGAGIVGVALGFGSQNLVRDFLSGVFMLLEDQYGVGDVIDIGEANGVVEGISLRTTRLRDVYGTVWYVPNGEIRRVGNKSQLWARSLIDIGVSYDTDLDHAQRVIKDVADSVWQDEKWADRILEEPEVWGIEDFGPTEVVIRLVVKVQPGGQWAVNREIRRRLIDAFEREGIEIPDQRTVFVREEPDGDAPIRPTAPAPAAAPAVGLGRDWGPPSRSWAPGQGAVDAPDPAQRPS
jgi:small conductance mechanosensitive channel